MKTNITINSPDRFLLGYNIRQQTKTEFLCLSDLQEAYTRARIKNSWSNKGEIQHLLSQKENAERIFYILKKREIINCEFSQFMEIVEKQGVIKTLKQFEVYKTSGARQNKATWCHIDIFVLTAIELNPSLYADVISWISDTLILNRIEAGNFYKALSKAVAKMENIDYKKLAKALNYKIFGRHEAGIRNLATKEDLKKLYELESKLAFLCDMGYINTFNEIINTIEKIDINKYD